jgi:hypothetical protein
VDDRKNLPDHEALSTANNTRPGPNFENLQKRSCFIKNPASAALSPTWTQPESAPRAELARNPIADTIVTNRTGTVNAANYIAWLRDNGYDLGSLSVQ